MLTFLQPLPEVGQKTLLQEEHPYLQGGRDVKKNQNRQALLCFSFILTLLGLSYVFTTAYSYIT